MLVLTTIFGIWAVGLVILTTVGILKPAYYYSDQKSALKAVGATVVALLAVSQTSRPPGSGGTSPSLSSSCGPAAPSRTTPATSSTGRTDGSERRHTRRHQAGRTHGLPPTIRAYVSSVAV
jgi:hypothetical protein